MFSFTVGYEDWYYANILDSFLSDNPAYSIGEVWVGDL